MEKESGIKKFRERMRYKTQSALANALGMEQQTLSNWESGNVPKNFEAIRKLLDLGITVEELFGFEYNEKHNLTEAKTELEPKHGQAQASAADVLKELGDKMNKMQAEIEELKNAQKQPSRQDAPPAVANLA